MRLRQPTDFQILEALEQTGRNVAPNLATHIDKSRKNINTRLPILEDYDLVDKIGPAERSGVYEITSLGKAALIYQDQYDKVDNFEELIEGPSAGTAESDGASATGTTRNGENTDNE